MGKPHYQVYEKFRKRFFEITNELGKEQYLVPYLMSSHPGSKLEDALRLTLELKKDGYTPEQVQDYYPTPGTASTVMYYTGINPLNGKKVYTATDYHDKILQRALLQYNNPKNKELVREALIKCNRTDLIGFGKEFLIPPQRSEIARKEAPRSQKGKFSKKNDRKRKSEPKANNKKR
jgi:radical SAM superfamily enzyme YgiQ (UPF0313 family)